MNLYRTIETSFWDDERIRSLPPDGKLLMLYLITNRHSHFSGIYYLRREEIVLETGISRQRVDTLCHTLSACRLVMVSTEDHVFWVVKMLEKQGRGQKNAIAAAKQLQTLHKCPLIKDFLEYYSYRRIPYAIPYAIPYTPVAVKDQDQDQDQDINSVSSEAENSPASKPPPVLIFPTLGKVKTWELTQAKIDEWAALYPGLDILGHCRRALAWAIATPAKRKTWKGMERFLVAWLNREVDKPRSLVPATQNPADDIAAKLARIRQEDADAAI